MQFLDLAKQFIPGYELLSGREQAAFQASIAGQKFVSIVNAYLSELNSFDQAAASWWMDILNTLWRPVTEKFEQDKQKLRKDIKVHKELLISAIQISEDYKKLITQITLQLLVKHYPDILLLDKKQQRRLASETFSQVLQSTLPPLDSITEGHQNLAELNELQLQLGFTPQKLVGIEEGEKLSKKKERIMSHWRQAFFTQLEMAPLRAKIAKRKAWVFVTQLAKVFPLLNDPILPIERNPFDQLVAKYSSEHQKEKVVQAEEEFLIDLLLSYLQKAVINQFGDFIAFDSVNKVQAKRLAKEILQAFNNEKELQIDAWFVTYQEELTQHILGYLLSGKQWSTEKNTPKQQLFGALSYLFHNEVTGKVDRFLNKMADAHAFIQATGFSTQNENSFLAILDFYNYARHSEQLVEIKTIFTSLLKPFLPLYQEYREIAFLYEQKNDLKIFRAVMPMLVIAAFVVLVAALLAPLAIPELAFLVASFPILFLGLALATKYVSFKNYLYQFLRQSYWGGPFKIPEFQINERMILSFCGYDLELMADNKALKARTLYITLDDASFNYWVKTSDDSSIKGCVTLEEIGFNHQKAVTIEELQKVKHRILQIISKRGHIHLDKENAEMIRDLYIEELKICNDINVSYQQDFEQASLTSAGLELQKENEKKIYSLWLEWYDIHSNPKVGYETVPQMVLERLSEIAKKEFQSLQSILQKQDSSRIKTSIKRVMKELKTTFLGGKSNSGDEVILVDENTSSALSEKSVVLRPANSRGTQHAHNYSPGLFRPLCLVPKCKLERLTKAANLISPQQNSPR